MESRSSVSSRSSIRRTSVLAALVLVAFNDNLVFFYSPSDLKAKAVASDRRVRIGGLVERESLSRGPDGRQISFRVTDGATDLAVIYEGLLPDLFREGQGVVAEGKLRADGIFAATTVLAKHDENYMPREVVEALKKSGHWQEGGASKAAAGPVAVTPADPRDGPQGPAARGGVQGVAAKPAAPGFPLSRE